MKRRVLLYLLIAALPLMGLKNCGGCSGSGGEAGEEDLPTEGGGVPASANYTFKRGEIGATYNTGSSASKNYKASSQLGWFLSEGVTLSDSYKTFHPMSQEILQRPPTLRAGEDENLPEVTPP